MGKNCIISMLISFLIVLLSSSLASSKILLENESLKDINSIRLKRSIPQIITDTDIHSVLSRFADINNTLNKLQDIFTAEPPEKCTLSYEKLLQLKDSIDEALSGDDQGDLVNCDVNVENPDGSCNELVSMIQCGVNEMTNALQDAMDNNEKLVELQKQYEALQEEYQKFLDENENYISAAAKEQIDELTRQLQEQQELINKLLDKLLQEMTELIAIKIQLNRISEAVEKFIDALDYNFDYVELVELTVTKAYAYEFVENILNFLKLLPAHAYANVGCDKLIDLLKENDELSDKNLLQYYALVAPDEDHDERVKTFKNKLSDEYFRVISLVAIEMRKGNRDLILSLSDNLSKCRFYAEDTVLEALNSTAYYYYVEYSIHNLRPNFDGYCVSSTTMAKAFNQYNLIDGRESFDYALETVDNLKMFLDDPKHWLSKEQNAYSLCINRIQNVLKNELPASITDVFLKGNNCKIVSIDDNAMIYADDYTVDGQRSVFTKPYSDTSDDRAKWFIDPLSTLNGNNGIVESKVHFWIKNVHYNEYLMINRHGFDGKYDKAFTGKYDKGESFWIFYSGSNATKFKIRNENYGDDLISNDERVNTKVNPADGENYEWKFVC